ncbi:mannosyl-glycoprotein endo-beta-N-acetylglucosamidase, partial [Butyricicoccus sp. 1XD8-22]
ITAGSTYTNFVYYIKKQSIVNGATYFLISKQQSDTKGTVGWVNEKDLSTRVHKQLDSLKKDIYIKGTGSAYSKIWGGRKEIVYSDLKQHADKVFHINFTEKAGNDVWYRGTLNSKTIWIHSSNLKESKNTSTQNNMTL